MNNNNKHLSLLPILYFMSWWYGTSKIDMYGVPTSLQKTNLQRLSCAAPLARCTQSVSWIGYYWRHDCALDQHTPWRLPVPCIGLASSVNISINIRKTESGNSLITRHTVKHIIRMLKCDLLTRVLQSKRFAHSIATQTRLNQGYWTTHF